MGHSGGPDPAQASVAHWLLKAGINPHHPHRFQAGISLTGREARTVMGRQAGGMVLPCLSIPWWWHFATWCIYAMVVITWQLSHGKLWGCCTHVLCTSSLCLLKKVALQPYICMGGPTHGLIHGHACYIPMRPASGISGWPRDMPPSLVPGKIPVLVKV